MRRLQRKKWLFLAASVVFLACWAGLGIAGRYSRPEAVVCKFQKAYMKMDTKRMVKCYEPKKRKEKKETFKELARLQGPVSGYLVKGKVIAGDVVYGEEKYTAEVSCAIVAEEDSGNGPDMAFFKLKLVKAGNKWYIDE